MFDIQNCKCLGGALNPSIEIITRTLNILFENSTSEVTIARGKHSIEHGL